MDGLEMWIFPHAIEKTGATGALVCHEMRPPNLHGRLVYISVPDCWERQSWAVAKNSSVYMPKTDIGEHGLLPLLAIMKTIVPAFTCGLMKTILPSVNAKGTALQA